MPFTEATIEPTPAEPVPADTPLPPSVASPPPSNDDDTTALARLEDDGAPPPPETDPQEVSLAPIPADPIPPAPQAIAAPLAIPAETPSLEQRVRRLEDALAQLQEQRGMETRIVAHPPALPPAVPPPRVPPPASPPSPAVATALFDAGKRLLGAATHPAANAAGSPAASSPSTGGGILWLLWDTWAEARAIVRMFIDPRYHLPWSSRVIPLLLLAAFLIPKKYWVPGAQIPLLGDWLFSQVIDLLLAFLLFKWLGHEARRYRQTSPDLPPTLRL